MIKHIVKESSREHVVWWDSCGSYCSESNCEINHEREKRIKEKNNESKRNRF